MADVLSSQKLGTSSHNDLSGGATHQVGFFSVALV